MNHDLTCWTDNIKYWFRKIEQQRTRVLKISPPLRILRLISGGIVLVTGIGLAAISLEFSSNALIRFGTALGLIAAGLGLAFLERVLTLDADKPSIREEWLLAGIPLHRRAIDLKRADRVRICSRQEPVISDAGLIYVADRTYPVLVCAGNETLARITGEDPNRVREKRIWEFSFPSPAFFLSFSQHAAAVCARALNLPLDDTPGNMLYQPGQIPREWLDSAHVKAVLSWRRYGRSEPKPGRAEKK